MFSLFKAAELKKKEEEEKLARAEEEKRKRIEEEKRRAGKSRVGSILSKKKILLEKTKVNLLYRIVNNSNSIISMTSALIYTNAMYVLWCIYTRYNEYDLGF